MPASFTPTLYLKRGCPHCFKLSLFLLEAGLAGEFALRQFTPGDEAEVEMRAELAPHFARVTFPTVQFAPGIFMNESNDIIAHIAGDKKREAGQLPLLRTYTEALLPRIQHMQKENADLKARLSGYERARSSGGS